MRYLLTGGAGFVGSHLSELLLSEGHKVHVLDDLSTGSIRNIESLKVSPNFSYTIDSIFNDSLTAELVDDADIKVIREKARKRIYAKIDLLEANVSEGTFLYAGFSALDIYLTSMMRWGEQLGLSVKFWPRIEAIVSTVRQRPAYLAMMEKQEISWPLTDTPKKKRLKDRIFW